jgi:tetratricopeptide (TPR) repeat protein
MKYCSTFPLYLITCFVILCCGNPAKAQYTSNYNSSGNIKPVSQFNQSNNQYNYKPAPSYPATRTYSRPTESEKRTEPTLRAPTKPNPLEPINKKDITNQAQANKAVPKYTSIASTANEDGLRLAQDGFKFGYINNNDEEIIKVIYDQFIHFPEGNYACRFGSKWGIISKDNVLLASWKYDGIISGFINGTATVTNDGRTFFINEDGNEVVNKKNVTVKKATPINNKPASKIIEPRKIPGTGFYTTGYAKYLQRDFKGAVHDFTQAIMVNQNYQEAWFYRAFSREELNDHIGAIADYDKVIYFVSDFSGAYYNRGLIKSDLKDYKGAIDDMTKTISLDSKDFSAYQKRGIIRAILNDDAGAIADYTKVIELSPLYADAWYNRGNAKSRLKNKEAAITDYNKTITIDASYAGAYFNRATCWYELGQYKASSVADYTKSLEIKPNDPNAYYMRGITKIYITQKESGCEDLKKALALGSTDANTALTRYCK